MGFFANLFDSVKSAGMWALNNAGSIADVVGTVAKVAGSLAAPSETVSVGDTESDHLIQFHQNFDLVSKKLNDMAVESASHPPPSLEADQELLTLKDSVTGIWKDPATLTPQNLPTQTMYEDLSKFLGQMNVPTTFKLDGGKEDGGKAETIDVVNKLGAALFDLGKPVPGKINRPTFMLDLPGGSLCAAHAWYSLPMGHAGDENSLHSAMAVRYHTTKAHHKSYLSDSFNTAVTSLKVDAPGWLVTFNLSWHTAIQASAVQKKFTTIFSENYKELKIETSTLTGTLQLLKVHGPGTATPAGIRSAVQFAADKALTDASSESRTPKSAAEGEIAAYGVPVELLNSTYVLGKTSSTEATG